MKSRIGNRTSQTITSDGALTTALMTTTTTTLQFDSNLYVRYAHHGHEPLYLLSTNNMLFIWWCFFFISVLLFITSKSLAFRLWFRFQLLEWQRKKKMWQTDFFQWDIGNRKEWTRAQHTHFNWRLCGAHSNVNIKTKTTINFAFCDIFYFCQQKPAKKRDFINKRQILFELNEFEKCIQTPAPNHMAQWLPFEAHPQPHMFCHLKDCTCTSNKREAPVFFSPLIPISVSNCLICVAPNRSFQQNSI